VAAAVLAAPAAQAQIAPRGDASPASAALRVGPIATPDQASAPKVEWDPRWPRFSTAEYIATGVFGAATFASLAIPPSEGQWSGINGFDGAARDALRIRSDRMRNVARDASDLVIGLMINHLTIDVALVTWWGHGRGSVAWELAMMDAEALAVNAALNGLVAGFASRERPYRDGCEGPEEKQNIDCRSSKRYRSFFSGHSSTSFTIAGLTCSHHANLPLYGGGAPDAIACAGSLAAAATVSTMRVVSDQHFASDALTGAGVGALIGFGLPWLLHYRGGAAPPPSDARPPAVSLRVVPAGLGASLVGTF
jgi:membrane-associated phospholipid phosphatase